MEEKRIEKEIDTLVSLQALVRAFGEIASTRMMQVRGTVLKSREFLSSIHDLFTEVLISYAQRATKLAKSKNTQLGEQVTFLAHNGKTVAVLLSANTGFFGDVVIDTFNKFVREIQKQNAEVTIVGKLGLKLFQEAMPTTPYTYFDLPDRNVESDDLAQIVAHLVQYEEIHIYYGAYQSVVKQSPHMFNISAAVSPVGESKTKAEHEYIFEPNLEEILRFFEKQIFASLFEQTVRESQLAKLASRIMAMDRAEQNIDQRLNKEHLKRLKAHHRKQNRVQLGRIIPVMAMEMHNG